MFDWLYIVLHSIIVQSHREDIIADKSLRFIENSELQSLTDNNDCFESNESDQHNVWITRTRTHQNKKNENDYVIYTVVIFCVFNHGNYLHWEACYWNNKMCPFQKQKRNNYVFVFIVICFKWYDCLSEQTCLHYQL